MTTTAVFVDYYELLGVDPAASSAEIKAAYRARMVRDHADQNPGDELAKERMILLTRAKTTLLDEHRRMAFDRERMSWFAAARIGMAPPRWSGGRAPDPGDGSVHHVHVDLRDVSLGRLIVGVGVAAVVTGLGLAAKAVADRAGRKRRRSWL
ncbi:MAG TPA: DnaJ domain-containing protein [Enhygromyxa sp.]|nr:DnaJ domain-containing protein [Enhygromyxa sp.]